MGNANQKAFEIAKVEINVSEAAGPKASPRIVEYHQATKLRATSDEVPWCSSFVNWCFKKAGYVGTESAMARSWLLWGNKVETPVPGDIVIFKRGNDGVSGHVAFLAQKPNPLSPWVYVLGGNQSNKVCVAKYSKLKVIGYRRS